MVASARSSRSALLAAPALSIPQLFLVVGVLNALVAVYIYTLVPEFLMRFLAWLLVHTVYRVRQSRDSRTSRTTGRASSSAIT